MFLEQLVCEPAAPELIGFRFIFRPWQFLAAKLNCCLALEVDRLLQQLFDLGNTFIHAFRIEIVNFVSRFQRAEKHVARDRVAIFRIKFIDIFLGEKQMAVIQ